MCDHYDRYYSETPEEARANLIAAKKEAARVAAFRKEKEDKLIAEYSAKFGVTINQARKEVRRIK